MSVPADARERRAAALRGLLASSSTDTLLVTSLPNIRYLTGFSGSSALLVVSQRETLFITDFRYATQAHEEVGSAAQVVIESASLWARLWTGLPGMAGVEVVGFESAHLLHSDFQRLGDAGARWQWRPTQNLVESLREQKDAGEVDCIRHAIAIAQDALERTARDVRAGLTELDVCGRLEHWLREMGSEAHPFETIVAAGERSALPHARASMRKIADGDFLLIDFGAVYAGYCADLTRTFVVGRATDAQRSVHEIVREANATASAGVRAGMRGRDADAIARGYIHRRGFGEEFGHSLGHGIGLEVHESPRLSRTADAPLPTGAVVTIEPGIYRSGWGGVRIEDDVHLTAEGPVVLSSYARELIELGM